MNARPPRLELARVALTTGLVGFGGGFAVVAKVGQLVVADRAWLDEGTFIEHVAIASALPGTTATNLFTLLGYRMAGVSGAVIASVAFVTPSALLMVAFGAFYEHLRAITALEAVLGAMGAAVVGVVAAVANDFRKSSLTSANEWLVAIGATVALVTRALSLLEVVVLAGLLGMLAFRPPPPPAAPAAPDAPAARGASDFAWVLALAKPGPALAASSAVALAGTLFFVFAKIGAATFGGGFAMVPPMTDEALSRGWLGARELSDAVALGQLTPGPVAICATFIGYRVAGLTGALAATLGIFLPPFLVTTAAARSLDTFRTSRVLRGFLRGISAAVVGIIAAAAVALFRVSVHDAFAVALAVGALAVRLFLRRTGPVAPLVLAAIVALVASLFGVVAR